MFKILCLGLIKIEAPALIGTDSEELTMGICRPECMVCMMYAYVRLWVHWKWTVS